MANIIAKVGSIVLCLNANGSFLMHQGGVTFDEKLIDLENMEKILSLLGLAEEIYNEIKDKIRFNIQAI